MIFRITKYDITQYQLTDKVWKPTCLGFVRVGDLSEGLLRGMLADHSGTSVEYSADKIPIIDGLDELAKLLRQEERP